VQQGGEDGALGPGQCGLADLSLQDGELVAQEQDHSTRPVGAPW